LLYAHEVGGQVRKIERKHHKLIRRCISEQLRFTPERITRNRKPLEDIPGPLGSTWELRFGPDNRFRVFYDVVPQDRVVWILAIGVKIGNRLLIGGEEIRS
jgi:mRNA-degrading endonuclease RelE of RelBE toxin-antitoxin system